jgi:hypothetical protein
LSIKQLYRGLPVVLIGGTPGTMLYLCSYDWIQRKLETDSFIGHFGGGMAAEAIACIIYVPVDVLKERLQVQSTYRNTWHGLQQIWHQEGLRGIYKGYGATLASFGPFSAFYFLFYEQFKAMARRQQRNHDDPLEDLPFQSILCCSCSAGALASWITSPLDMAKLRLQVQRANNKSDNVHYRNMGHVLQQTWRAEGLMGLFRGSLARVLHFAPATTITMTCYETFRSLFAKYV